MVEHSSDGTAYTISGPADAPLVVLIHGVGLNRHIWQWHSKTLSERFRVIAYDLPGHGDTPTCETLHTLTLYADQVQGLLDHVGADRAALVGFSLGGMINRRFAIDHPERVSALAILNSPHERSPAAQRLVEERVAATSAGGPAATVETTLERWFTDDFRAQRPEIVAEVRNWVLANDPQTFAGCRRVLATGVTELVRPSAPISHPTLVMTAENDSGSTPEMTHAIASEISGARTIVVPRLQHMALVEAPDLFTAPLIDFLSETVT